MLHRFAKFLVACTVLLILAGSLVTSHDAGLSVPDWPTSYGWNMFTFPPSMWVANILYEHGHRLIASTVGFLTIVMAVWLWIGGPAPLAALVRRRHARLGRRAGPARRPDGAVLPAGGHLDRARRPRGNFLLHDGRDRDLHVARLDRRLRPATPGSTRTTGLTAGRTRCAAAAAIATTATILIYTQILVGATMRHTGAGLAIPDFPLMFGHVIPDHWSGAIAIHFAHRVGALLVTLAIVTLFAHVWSRYRDRPRTDAAGGAARRARRRRRSRSAPRRCSAAAIPGSTASTSSAARWC